MSQQQPRPRRSTSNRSGDQNDESAGDRETDRDALYARGRTKCGDVERRRLIEEVGREDAVTFIGDAAAAGRQATEIEDQESGGHE